MPSPKMANALRFEEASRNYSEAQGSVKGVMKGLYIMHIYVNKSTVMRRVWFVGQLHIDPLTSAAPGARLATCNKGL
jgi:ribosomal protein L22